MFSWSYCYACPVGYWHHDVVRLWPVGPSIRLSVGL